MAGYSGSPLVKKLGIKEGARVLLIHPPNNYFTLIGHLPNGANLVTGNAGNIDFIHLFVNDVAEMEEQLPLLKQQMSSNGMLWVSWNKSTAKIKTTVNEALIRKAALSIGLVDIKVCAIDDIWSALKLVIRKGDRK